MSLLLQIAVFLVLLLVAARRARPALPPYGTRMAGIGLLLLAQAILLHGFVSFHRGTGWGLASATPGGLVLLVQTARLVLLAAAFVAWVGLVGHGLSARGRVAIAVGLVLLGFTGGAAIGTITLLIVLSRHKWIEAVDGWRRALGFFLSSALLVIVSLYPVARHGAGGSSLQLTLWPSPWPPALLVHADAAARELALARPLDRAVQALVDLFRIQLLLAALRLLTLPVRLSGVSLKRRFTINFMLVRSVPSLLAALLLAGVFYFTTGMLKASTVRHRFEETQARAATIAEALAADPSIRAGVSAERLAAIARWMGDDGRGAHVVVRADSLVAAHTPRAPAAVLARALDVPDSVMRGLAVRGDTIYLAAARRSADRRTLECWVPIDTSYLARVRRETGGDLRLTALPNTFTGVGRVEFASDSAWTTQRVRVAASDPARDTRTRPWFLNRTYLETGDWSGRRTGARRGAIELQIATTPRALLSSTIRSFAAPSSLVVIGILFVIGTLISMIESFAVRSGRSILDAVLEEIGTLRHAALEFGRGHLGYRLPVKGKDELSVVASSFNDMAASLEQKQRELLETERFEEDLAVARQIQRRFLPQEAPRLTGLDVAGVSLPSREVGGDLFYWFTHDDGSLGFVLGDVSGKSVPAALLMSNVLAALRTQALDRVDLAKSLARTNRLIVDQVEPGRFVTLFHGEADPARGTLHYASAGHNPPLLIRAGGALEWLREGGLPLGVDAGASYTVASTRFEAGDTLLVYSDGVTEATAGSAPLANRDGDAMFGEERLADAARGSAGRSARATLDALLAAVESFSGGLAQADDVTIVVVRRA